MPDERLRRVAEADLPQRTNGGHGHFEGALAVEQRHQRRSGRRILRALQARAPQTPRCISPGPRPAARSAGCARGSLMRCSAYATGHHRVTGRPPSSTAAASGSYAPSRTSAKMRELECLRFRRRRPGLVIGLPCRRPPRGARIRRRARRPPLPLSLAPISPSASAARPRTIGTVSASACVRRRSRRRVADQAERERRRLPDLGDPYRSAAPVSGATPSGSPTRPIASAARRRTRGSASAISATRSPTGAAAPAAPAASRPRCRHHYRRRRRRLRAQDALILELKDPGHLLLEGNRRRTLRWRRRSLARGGQEALRREMRWRRDA